MILRLILRPAPDRYVASPQSHQQGRFILQENPGRRFYVSDGGKVCQL